MMNTNRAPRRAPHTNSAALAEIIGRSPHGEWGRRAHLASAAGVSPATVRDLTSGRRLGTNPEIREAIAHALGVPVAAITCWCHRPDGHCLSAQEDAA